MKTLNTYSRIAIAISACLILIASFLPLWQILMWAPQYPGGLQMKIWINDITGDVKIISALNHYIGMKHIEVTMFPEFSYMKYIVAVVIAIGLITALVNKRIVLVIYSIVIIGCGIAALVDFYNWGYDYGHNLDPKAPIVVPGMSYQPPLIGTKKLLNFTAFSGPDIGGWLFLTAGILAIGSLTFELYISRKNKSIATKTLITIALCLTLVACNFEPEPIQYGKDACHNCKMTLMDKKFGAEIVTTKGKVFKFDDTNCLVNFMNSDKINKEDIANILVVDFGSPGKLIDAKSALYVKSDKINSPMAGNVAAFSGKDKMQEVNNSWKGDVITWDDLIKSQ